MPLRPYRVTGCGYPTGLSVLLSPQIDDYFGSYLNSYGFRILIHDAYNVADQNADTKVVTTRRESFIRINPESTYATTDIQYMPKSERNCLFGHERKMAYMQKYSFINCMAECRSQIMFERCNCVPLYMTNNGSYPLCLLRQMKCVLANRGGCLHLRPLNILIYLHSYRLEIFTRAVLDNNRTLFQNMDSTEGFPCNCLPDCESNHYPSEITTGRLNVKESFNKINTGYAELGQF